MEREVLLRQLGCVFRIYGWQASSWSEPSTSPWAKMAHRSKPLPEDVAELLHGNLFDLYVGAK